MRLAEESVLIFWSKKRPSSFCVHLSVDGYACSCSWRRDKTCNNLAELGRTEMGWPVLLLALLVVPGSRSLTGPRQYSRCERITIPMCLDMRYNMTLMPTMSGHTSQADAGREIQEYIPLVEIGCSKLLKFFLCSTYAPMCTEQVDETLVIPACRSMCLDVQASCLPVLERFDFKWPDILDCSKLPVRSDRTNLCMEAPNITDEPVRRENTEWWKKYQSVRDKSTTKPPKHATSTEINHCPDRFVHVEYLHNRNNSCAPRCNMDVYFRKEDKRFSEIWTIVWASLCCLSTSITVLTFVIDTTRFKYPERPIIFLSMCYSIYSMAYMIRAITGPSAISCDRGRDGTEFLIQEGLESTWCIIVFLILYFFGMAGSLWWVILTLTWFLAAGRKWGQEAIEAFSSYFHLAAWAIPAIKTIIILTMRRVDGDELTGMCYVGNQDISALTGFVLAPLLVYLIIGTMFILAGFTALFRIRNDLKHEGTNIRKLEKLMAKIGIFSVLYTVPATCVIGCHFYERMNYQRWRNIAMATDCRVTGDDKKDCTLDQSIPTVEVYMLKIFMSLIVGITSGMWIWSSKTVSSWKKCCCSNRFTRGKSNSPNLGNYQQAPVIIMKNQGPKQTPKTSGSQVWGERWWYKYEGNVDDIQFQMWYFLIRSIHQVLDTLLLCSTLILKFNYVCKFCYIDPRR